MGAFCFHGNQSFDPIWPKTLCNLSPTLMMLHIKFDQHWPTGLRDIQVSSELWQNDSTQNSGRTRQIQYSPTFSKRGYKNYIPLGILHMQGIEGGVSPARAKIKSHKQSLGLMIIWKICIPNQQLHKKTCLCHMRTTKVQISLRI